MSQPSQFASITSVQEFLKRLDDLFEKMVNPWSEVLFRRDERDLIRAAWDAVRPKFTEYRDRIDFGDMAVRRDLEREGLGMVGGSPGPELALKLHLLNQLWERFDWLGGKKLLKDLLDYINAILKSIIEAIPGGGFVEEFKTALEKAMDCGDD